MNKFTLSLLVALAYTACLKAQNVNGIVMDNDSARINYATVSLLNANDSSYITGVMTDEGGNFSFDTSPANKLVRISYIGYKTLIMPASNSIVALLEHSEQSLKEVVITSARPTFKMNKGVFVSNIQGTVFSKLGKATDVLQQMPMMSSDGISVLGKGTPLVYINNKQMRSWNELERISSDMIKEIRIDMNPGAKYGSNVRAVLFITTLKPVGEGFGGTLTMKESVSSCWNTDGWLDLNYRKKGVDVFVSSSFNTFSNSHHKRRDVYCFQHKGSNVNADYEGDGYNSSRSGFISVGFNNQLSETQFFGGTYTFSRLFAGKSKQKYQNHLWKDDVFSEFGSDVHNFSQSGNHAANVYYENKISEKLTLNVDGGYMHNSTDGKQTVVETQNNNSTSLVPATKTNADMGALKSVLTSSIGNAKVECGFETTYTRFQQKYNVENNDYAGVLKTNDNESRQSAANIFVNYSQSIGKLYTQLGLKYEYANYDYYASGKLLNESCRTYHRVLPSASFAYDIKKLSLMLSYNIYTDSPTYSQLDDGLQYISELRYNKGNSMLKPTYNHDVSLNASYGDLQFTSDYTYQKDAIVTWFDVMEEIPAILSSDINHSYPSLYVSLSYAPTFFNIWKPSWNLWANKQWLTCHGLSYNRPQFGLQWKNLLTLPRNWFVLLNVNGNLRGNADTYMARSSVKMDMTVQKNMKNWWIKLSAFNVFNAKEKGFSQYGKIYTSHYVDYQQPTVCLTISYTLNPAKSKYKGQTAGQSEIDRLQQK